MNRHRVQRVLVEALWAGAIVVTSVVLARAAPATDSAGLGVVGTLRISPPTAIQVPRRLTFNFKGSAGRSCRAADVQVSPAPSSGAFRAQLDLGNCSEVLEFGDLSVDVDVEGINVIQNQALAPAPTAVHAERVGSAECPVGYARRPASGITLCQRGADEVVKVGEGAAAFWVDRYEASLWTQPDGLGSRVTPEGDKYPSTFPRSGQTSNAHRLFAASVANVPPNDHLTWFQATGACRASGKRLMRADEWFAAARGTIDPPSPSTGTDGSCNTQSGAARATGAGVRCVSIWGAEDLIGNLWEWTADWHAAVASVTKAPWVGYFSWPEGYGNDATYHVGGSTRSEGVIKEGLPAAALRGGDFANGVMAGRFALSVLHAPSSVEATIGFRCVVDR